jgi:DegV family protein with EDD domain
MPIAVVTDSTASLPPDLVADAAVTVVPLTVVIDGVPGREGADVTTDDVARALVARRVAVTTSRPSPAEFSAVYARLLAGGADGVVSVHLSAKLSGTYDSAALAAADHPGRVAVVDSLSTGMGLGFAALHARGTDLAAARDAALAAVARTTTLFYVDTLEHLRRGGRIGAASALLGTALSVKPILRMVDGEIVVQDKVRTATRALGRLVDLAAEAAGESEVDIAVHHLAAPARAAELTEALTQRLGGRIRSCYQTEIGAAVGAHVGPGLASVVVHSRSNG